MTIFKTKSGSMYEVEEKRFRRLCGSPFATHRAAKGDWLGCIYHTPIKPGNCVRFFLDEERTLLTSRVVEVILIQASGKSRRFT